MLKKYLALMALMSITGFAQQAESAGGLPWWGWLIIIFALVVVALLIIQANPEKEPTAAAPLEPLEPSDLTLIEGIGPKIQSVLQASGIHTFAQLAEQPPQHLAEILQGAGLRLAVTDTWPQQANLAAQGKMDELKAFQDELTGGRVAR